MSTGSPLRASPLSCRGAPPVPLTCVPTAGTMAMLLSYARQSGCWDFFSRPNLLALLSCLQDSTNEVSLNGYKAAYLGPSGLRREGWWPSHMGLSSCPAPAAFPSIFCPNSPHLSCLDRSETWPQSCSSTSSPPHSPSPSPRLCSSWPRMPWAAHGCRRLKPELC